MQATVATREDWLERFPTARERALVRVMRWYWWGLARLVVVPFPFLITAHLHGLAPERGTWAFDLAVLTPLVLFILTFIGCASVWRFLSETGVMATLILLMFIGIASSGARYEDDLFDRMPMYVGWSVSAALIAVAAGGVLIRRALPKPPPADPIARSLRLRTCVYLPVGVGVNFAIVYTSPAPTFIPGSLVWFVFALTAALLLVPSALSIWFRAWLDDHRAPARDWMQNVLLLVSALTAVPATLLVYQPVYSTALALHPYVWWACGAVLFQLVLVWFPSHFLAFSFLAGLPSEAVAEDLDEVVALTPAAPVAEPVVVAAVTVPLPVRAPQHPSRAAASERRRRRQLAATVPGQEPTREFLAELRAGICVYCGDPASHADHIRPLARGGWHHELNLVPACDVCNTHSKNSRLLVEWAQTNPELVLHGMLTSPLVMAAYQSEMHSLTALHFRYPATSGVVRAACERYGRADLIRDERVSEVPINREPLEPSGMPFPPINNDDTHPEANAPKPRQWAAIGQRKANGDAAVTRFPDLAAALDQWDHTILQPTGSKELESASA